MLTELLTVTERTTFLVLSLGCLALVWADIPVLGNGDQPPLPTYTIKRATGKIVIDGVLKERDWKAAKSVGDFVFPWWKEGKKEQTIAKLLWDDENLYVAFQCEDAHIWAVHTQRDDPVSRDDCAEVFFAPDPSDVRTYFNFEFNVLGTLLDRAPYNNRSSKWNAEGLQVACVIDGTLNDDSDEDRGWVMEIALPFRNLVDFAPHTPPRNGDTWRLNLNRCGGKTDLQYSQWSSSATEKAQFHVPERFGIVRFSSKKVR